MSNLLIRSKDLNLSRVLFPPSKTDQLLDQFSAGMTDWKTLASLSAGGIAFQTIKNTCMMGTSFFSWSPLVAFPLGLAAEVSAYRFTQQLLKENQDTVFSKNWFADYISFFSIKLMGAGAQNQNPVFRHTTQSIAMVFGHDCVYQLGLGEKAKGNYFERLLEAETLNLQIQGAYQLYAFPLSRAFGYQNVPALQNISDAKYSFTKKTHDKKLIFSSSDPLAELRGRVYDPLTAESGRNIGEAMERIARDQPAFLPAAFDYLSAFRQRRVDEPWVLFAHLRNYLARGSVEANRGLLFSEVDISLSGLRPEEIEILFSHTLPFQNVRRLTLRDADDVQMHLLLPYLSQWQGVRDLSFIAYNGISLPMLLAASPMTKGLETLKIEFALLGPERTDHQSTQGNFHSLWTSETLANLREVEISNAWMRHPGDWMPLMESSHLVNLQRIRLFRCHLGWQLMANWAEGGRPLPRLEELDLSGNLFVQRGLPAMSRTVNFPALRQLILEENAYPLDLRPFARSARFRNVKIQYSVRQED